MRRLLAVAIAAAALCGPLAAQEPPAAGPPDTSAPAAEGAGTQSAAGLFAGTLGDDIGTASFYELASWCRRLGLAESGSRRELQDRLRQHYGLPAAAAPVTPGRTVVVRSARSAEYFTIEEVSESYLELSGDVVVEMRDPEAGATHTIRAGRLTYNQARRTLAAGDGVQYTLTEGGRTETFQGRSLTLNLDTWEAVFADGRSSKTQSRGDEQITFYFEGSSISRLSGDQIVLEDGTFTSCDLPDPHYAIRARKVWILAAGEWALRDAVLTVGRVPVLWLPFFFYPGDRLVFNPSFGYRQREGSFVQTTTYLIGRRKEEESMFSFLKLAEAEGTAYDQQLRGIFLRKLPAKASAPEATGDTLKLMLDAYSRLGVFLGMAGDFPPELSFMGGIGFSRNIYEDPATGLYTPYYPFVAATESDWNTSSLLGLSVPFRYGFAADTKGSRGPWSGALHFALFSDPFFSEDFHGRSEGLQLAEAVTTASIGGATAAATGSFTWEISNKLDFSKLVASPRLTTLTIPTLNGRFSWQSREQDYVDNSRMEWDPARTFYYPSSLSAPSASLAVAGELLRLGGAAKRAPRAGSAAPAAQRDEPGKGFRDPFAAIRAAQGAAPPAAPADRRALRAPAPRPDAAPSGAAPGPSLAVTYQATPRAALEHTFDAANWQTPADIDMAILYGTFETGGSGRVQAVSSLFGSRLDLSLSLGFDSLWRLRFSRGASLSDAEWYALVERDLQQDRLDFTSTIGATLRPFPLASPFSGSSLTWLLGMRAVRIRWDGADEVDPSFATQTFDLTKDTVSDHSLKVSVPFRSSRATAAFTMDAVLPPLDGNFSTGIDAAAWILKGRVQLGGTQTGGVWEAPNLLLRLSAEPRKGVSLSEELQADLVDRELSRLTTQLRAGGLSASFVAENRTPVDILTGLPDGPEAFLPSTATLAYEGSVGPLWSWKDRVKLEAGLRTSWAMNLQRYTDNLFQFAPRLTLSVSEFLDLSFTSLSVNTKTYRYLPGLPEPLGESWVNPVVDLVRSFNFFNPADRYASAFKIRSVSLKAVHHLHDWDLSVEYAGAPELVWYGAGLKQYEWSPEVTIQLQWRPVAQLKTTARADRDGIYLRQ